MADFFFDDIAISVVERLADECTGFLFEEQIDTDSERLKAFGSPQRSLLARLHHALTGYHTTAFFSRHGGDRLPCQNLRNAGLSTRSSIATTPIEANRSIDELLCTPGSDPEQNGSVAQWQCVQHDEQLQRCLRSCSNRTWILFLHLSGMLHAGQRQVCSPATPLAGLRPVRRRKWWR